MDKFVNADTLAQGLSAFRPEDVAVEAGRLTLARLDALEAQHKRFAFEATLASHGLVRRLARLKDGGYTVHVVFLWLPTVELALARVAERVRVGGHDVPADAVRRRFVRGRDNFFTRYRMVADTWRLYDASPVTGPRLVATGARGMPTRVRDQRRWRAAAEGYPMSETKPTLEELFEDGRAIDEALREAARDARRFHKAMGNPMATWIDGQVVWIQPEDIVVDMPPEDDDPGA